LRPTDSLVIIDEVQKLPQLLDEVHLLIERNKHLRFILTGSSARKLKRGQANLLAGRAWECRLHPLVSPEVRDTPLLDRLNRGGLPSVLQSAHHREDLRAYVGTYLHEEIRAEGLSRSIENFSRFLEVAGATNGEQVNFSSVGEGAGVPPRTIREYYQVLIDTLVGHMLPAYQRTAKRKPVATSKFFWFDVGVANALARRGAIEARSDAFGRALEHLVFLELRAFLDYRRIDLPLTYWRSRSQHEVDFVIGDDVGIEVKAKDRVSKRDYRSLLALAEEAPLRKRVIVCNESRRRTTDEGVEVMPIAEFLTDLWASEIV